MMRGFSTLVPILIASAALMAAVALASSEAYALRLLVLHKEHAAEADAAARSCAASVLLRLEETLDTPSEEITLGTRVLCTIERVERVDAHYVIHTSATVSRARVRWLTEVYPEQERISSRKI